MHAQNASFGPSGVWTMSDGRSCRVELVEGAQAVPDEDALVASALGSVHALDDLRVEDEAGGEREVACEVAVLALGRDAADREPMRLAALDDLDELRCRFDEIVREAEVACEDVRRAAGEDREVDVG